jgi:hypothetical protein
VIIRMLSNNQLGNKLFQNVSAESAAACPVRLRARFPAVACAREVQGIAGRNDDAGHSWSIRGCGQPDRLPLYRPPWGSACNVDRPLLFPGNR